MDRVKKELGNDFVFEVAKEGFIYDFLLIIGGCTNCCANYKGIQTKQGIFFVKDERDYEKVIDAIRKIIQ
ncbi:hypothetical protein FQB35_09330 [Crassaminicella thermophila]|uniref:Uncharacterized protein n=1 Tax=Crassaminicella thermophila TaxID=2599308 RepID=A0A5C0SDZ8_CRATE|nr:hypothetical protein [Crassaminicella thermophila]QEK12511.1 hypothetical protein FQB35_09330 [Crassaminicella thermophila]